MFLKFLLVEIQLLPQKIRRTRRLGFNASTKSVIDIGIAEAELKHEYVFVFEEVCDIYYRCTMKLQSSVLCILMWELLPDDWHA